MVNVGRVLAALVVGLVVSVGSLGAEPTRAELQNLYLEILKAEGFTPRVDDDGDVAFRYEGKTYYLCVNENDPEFFQLARFYFWELESDDEIDRAFQAASDASRLTKVAKVFLTEDRTDVSASVELLFDDPAGFRPHLVRSLEILSLAVSTFVDQMNEP